MVDRPDSRPPSGRPVEQQTLGSWGEEDVGAGPSRSDATRRRLECERRLDVQLAPHVSLRLIMPGDRSAQECSLHHCSDRVDVSAHRGGCSRWILPSDRLRDVRVVTADLVQTMLPKRQVDR